MTLCWTSESTCGWYSESGIGGLGPVGEFGAPRPIEDYVFLPEQDAVDPHHYGDDLYRPIVNSWWLTHQDKGLAFWNPVHPFDRLVRRVRGLGAPQCNRSEERRVGKECQSTCRS